MATEQTPSFANASRASNRSSRKVIAWVARRVGSGCREIWAGYVRKLE